MKSLSIDVWQHIFGFACTDGGRTSGSLSLTSRAFRGVSAPFRFHSVRLTTVEGLEKLLACYESNIDSAKKSSSDSPHVRHLVLAFISPRTELYSLDPHFHFMDLMSWERTRMLSHDRFIANMMRLLVLIAPTLQTLTVLQDPEGLLPYVPCPLPALRELTLLEADHMFLLASLGQDRPTVPSDKEFDIASSPSSRATLTASPIFPALRKLHFVKDRKEPLSALWAVAAPCLTGLGLTHTDPDPRETLHDVRRDSLQSFASLRTVTDDNESRKDAERSEKLLNTVILPAQPKQENWKQRLKSRWNSRASILTWAVKSFGF